MLPLRGSGRQAGPAGPAQAVQETRDTDGEQGQDREPRLGAARGSAGLFGQEDRAQVQHHQ